jgi:hypothetical protein
MMKFFILKISSLARLTKKKYLLIGRGKRLAKMLVPSQVETTLARTNNKQNS